MSLGLEATGGFQTVAFCENDEQKRALLNERFPGITCFPDVETLCADSLRGQPIDVLAGGFPCQDVSSAGRRAGLTGKRSGLWFEFARLIRELRPRFVLVENVPGLLSRGMGDVLGGLAASGYDAEWDCIPAAAVGAPHLRARIWILAYPRGFREQAHDTICAGRSELVLCPRWAPEPNAPRVDDGTSTWVLRSAGAAVVPQIPELIGNAILHAQRKASDVSEPVT